MRQVEPKGFTEVSALGVEEQRVNVIVDLPDVPASLGAAFRVEVDIETWRGEDVLTVPTSAIFRRDSGWRTFVVEDGRAHLRSVEIGHRSAQGAEVLQGLAAGDRVIVYPSDLIDDGVRVEARPGLEDEG